MYKMYFNTGVRPHNRLDKDGKVILMPFDSIRGGTIQIEYHLISEPPASKPKYLVPASYLTAGIHENEIAIKIIGGGTLSDYAIFNRESE